MKCTQCEKSVGDDLRFCPHCGFRFSEKEQASSPLSLTGDQKTSPSKTLPTGELSFFDATSQEVKTTDSSALTLQSTASERGKLRHTLDEDQPEVIKAINQIKPSPMKQQVSFESDLLKEPQSTPETLATVETDSFLSGILGGTSQSPDIFSLMDKGAKDPLADLDQTLGGQNDLLAGLFGSKPEPKVEVEIAPQKTTPPKEASPTLPDQENAGSSTQIFAPAQEPKSPTIEEVIVEQTTEKASSTIAFTTKIESFSEEKQPSSEEHKIDATTEAFVIEPQIETEKSTQSSPTTEQAPTSSTETFGSSASASFSDLTPSKEEKEPEAQTDSSSDSPPLIAPLSSNSKNSRASILFEEALETESEEQASDVFASFSSTTTDKKVKTTLEDFHLPNAPEEEPPTSNTSPLFSLPNKENIETAPILRSQTTNQFKRGAVTERLASFSNELPPIIDKPLSESTPKLEPNESEIAVKDQQEQEPKTTESFKQPKIRASAPTLMFGPEVMSEAMEKVRQIQAEKAAQTEQVYEREITSDFVQVSDPQQVKTPMQGSFDPFAGSKTELIGTASENLPAQSSSNFLTEEQTEQAFSFNKNQNIAQTALFGEELAGQISAIQKKPSEKKRLSASAQTLFDQELPQNIAEALYKSREESIESELVGSQDYLIQSMTVDENQPEAKIEDNHEIFDNPSTSEDLPYSVEKAPEPIIFEQGKPNFIKVKRGGEASSQDSISLKANPNVSVKTIQLSKEEISDQVKKIEQAKRGRRPLKQTRRFADQQPNARKRGKMSAIPFVLGGVVLVGMIIAYIVLLK